LKINLDFEDDNCDYLQQVIRSLHRQHGHGLPIDHSASRGWFWDIRPTQNSIEGSYQARSETAKNFPWHTDCSYEAAPPHYFALQVLQPDRCNGGTLSILKVDKLIDLLSEHTRSVLCRPEFRFDVPPEFIKKDSERHIVGTLLSCSGSGGGANFEARFREDIIIPLTRDAKHAFEELKSVLLGPEAAKHILDLTPDQLPRGSIILLDNRRWLHARNQVKDPKRHLRRVRWDACPFGPVGSFDGLEVPHLQSVSEGS
jgi:Taurine catabolism dioxygenase TauD, TfdA family